MNKRQDSIPQFESVEQERDYWEARGPLGTNGKSRLNKPAPSEQRTSFLTVRLSGDELTRLRDLAVKYDCGPSTLARRVLVGLLEQVEKASKQEDTKTVRTITLDELGDFILTNIPETIKQKMETLVSSSITDDASKPSFLIMDPAQLEGLKEISSRFISWIFESANPNVKVITPYDANYDKVRATYIEKNNQNNRVKV